MKKHKPLTRSCVVCGIEKPLSAFLQLNSKQGASYGTICGTCRGAGLKEKTVQEDERGSASSSMRIGVKQRVDMEKQQKRALQERQNLQEESTKKREQISHDKTEVLDQKEFALKRREQKQSFLNYQTKPQQPLSAQSMLHHKKDERLFTGAPQAVEKQQAIETARQVEAVSQEKRNTTIDLSGSPIVDQQHNVISRDNPTFKKFQAWLGADAPMMKTLSQLYKTSAASQAPAVEKGNQETPRQFAERMLAPSSRKK